MNERQEKYANGAPDLYQGIVRKAFQKTASPRAAIKAKCLACANWERKEITLCTVTLCPLWEYRPYQGAQECPVDHQTPSTEALCAENAES